jgi:hypothetical protein
MNVQEEEEEEEEAYKGLYFVELLSLSTGGKISLKHEQQKALNRYVIQEIKQFNFTLVYFKKYPGNERVP